MQAAALAPGSMHAHRAGARSIAFAFPVPPDSRFFGLGGGAGFVEATGRSVTTIVSEPGWVRGKRFDGAAFCSEVGARAHAVPLVWTPDGAVCVFLNSTQAAQFDTSTPGVLRVEVDVGARGAAQLYAGTARSPKDCLRRFASVAGGASRHALPPWTQRGAILAVRGGQARAQEVFSSVVAAGAPVAALWVEDWSGRTALPRGNARNRCCWTPDTQLYPRWPRVAGGPQAPQAPQGPQGPQGPKVVAYISPFIEARAVCAQTEVARRVGALQQQQQHPDREYRLPRLALRGELAFLCSCEAARAVVRRALRQAGAGVSGWMADFGDYFSIAESDPAESNRAADYWAALVADEARRVAGSSALVFARAGSTHAASTGAVMWAHDQSTSWDGADGMRSALRIILGGGASGAPYWHSDIGGYRSSREEHRDPELLMRWVELSAFADAVFRTHRGNVVAGVEALQLEDSPDTLRHFARFATLHCVLGSYRLGLAAEAERGTPLTRALVLEYPRDATAIGIDDQFVLGRDVLVAPVLAPGISVRRVYLPRGQWRMLWSGMDAVGPAWLSVAAPLGAPAVFTRKGSAVGAQLARHVADPQEVVRLGLCAHAT